MAIGQMQSSVIDAKKEFKAQNPRYVNDIVALPHSIKIKYS